jgi:hypothetical protein
VAAALTERRCLRSSEVVRAPEVDNACLGNSRGPLRRSGLSPIPHWAANKILQALAVDCVLPATGSQKIFGDQIMADTGRSYGVSHSSERRCCCA